MKIIAKGLSSLLIVSLVVLNFTMCTNTKKGAEKDIENLENKAKNEVESKKESAEAISSQEKLKYDFKIAHAKALIDLEKAKMHFIAENDKIKAKVDLDKAIDDLKQIDNTGNKDYDKFTSKTIDDITSIQQGLDNDKNDIKSRLNKMGIKIGNQIDELADDTDEDISTIEKSNMRHYAELRAKHYLYKALYESNSVDTFDKAAMNLDKAQEEYSIAKKYGNDKYNASLEKLEEKIMMAKENLAEEKAGSMETVNIVIYQLDSISNHNGVDYPYIMW